MSENAGDTVEVEVVDHTKIYLGDVDLYMLSCGHRAVELLPHYCPSCGKKVNW